MVYHSVFLDTNILIDYLTARNTSEKTVVMMLEMIKKDVDLKISVSSVCTLLFFLEKQKSSLVRVKTTLANITKQFMLTDTKESCLLTSSQSNFTDLEDAILYYTAIEANCDVFITNNVKDFPSPHPIPIYTPEQMLEQL